MMATRPQAIGYALTDSPAALAASIYDYNNGEPERLLTNKNGVRVDFRGAGAKPCAAASYRSPKAARESRATTPGR
jgi:hypothetical protein